MKRVRQNVLIGSKFGELEVLDNLYIKGVGYLKVKCSCGESEVKRKWPIVNGKVKECCKCTDKIRGQKRRKGFSDITGTIMGNIRRNAESRGLKLLVSAEFLYELFLKQNGKCAISGLDISIEKINNRNRNTASLDRINSLKDYTEDNVQWVHKDINIMKLDYDQDYFIELCKKVADNDRSRGRGSLPTEM